MRQFLINFKEAKAITITTIGIDLAKNVFQIHGVDGSGQAVLKNQLRRNQVLTYFAKLTTCVIGIEAYGGAHYWARNLRANKTDTADAEAICEAVTQPNMRFGAIKKCGATSSFIAAKGKSTLC